MDDNTPYVAGGNASYVVKHLEEVSCAIFQWFKDNAMKANADNYHTINELSIKINVVQIKNSQLQKLLGINFNNDLNLKII